MPQPENEETRTFDGLLLASLLADPGTDHIVIYGPQQVFIRRGGSFERATVQFDDEAHLLAELERMAAIQNAPIEPGTPLISLRLPGGWQVEAALPPVAAGGPVLTLRRLLPIPNLERYMVEQGILSPDVADFLRACVVARLNILIAGSAGPMITLLLNLLANCIPDGESVVLVEQQHVLHLDRQHLIRLASVPPVTARDLVQKAVRLEPDRIIVDDLHGGEALDLLHAMAGGFDGSLAALHADSPRDALHRLEVACRLAGADYPLIAIRQLICMAIQFIVHVRRVRGGLHRITNVTEIQGMSGDVITLTDIFACEWIDYSTGHLRPTGLRPLNMMRFEEAGIRLPPSVFGVGPRPHDTAARAGLLRRMERDSRAGAEVVRTGAAPVTPEELRARVARRLIDPAAARMLSTEELRAQVEAIFAEAEAEGLVLSAAERERLMEQIIAEYSGDEA